MAIAFLSLLQTNSHHLTIKFERSPIWLGLSIVQLIVQRHQGTLTVESALGKGSTFTIQLPLAN